MVLLWIPSLDYASFQKLPSRVESNLHKMQEFVSFLTLENLFDSVFEGYSDLLFKCVCSS